MPLPPLPIFDPTPEVAAQVLHDIHDPGFTLFEIARTHGTTTVALDLWLLSPEISSQLDSSENACARRARLLSTDYLSAAVKSVHRILVAYNEDESHNLYHPNSIQGHEQCRRNRETARRAVALLLRLARFHPNLPRPDRPESSAPPSPSSSSSSSNSSPPPSPTPEPSIPDLLDFLNKYLPPQSEPISASPPRESPSPDSTPPRIFAHESNGPTPNDAATPPRELSAASPLPSGFPLSNLKLRIPSSPLALPLPILSLSNGRHKNGKHPRRPP